MKIVVAPDSFKGSLTAIEAASLMKKGITEIIPKAKVVLKPMADGGEGTLDNLTAATNSESINIHCTGPLGTQIQTNYRILHDNTAIIEVANIAGLTQVPNQLRNPDRTTSYGIGEVILHALGKGCTHFIIALGGSAINDGGWGMLQALGMQAFNHQHRPLDIFGKDMFHLAYVDLAKLDPRLQTIQIEAACDVDNPLLGKQGASAVFGPQKGATNEQVLQYDLALKHFSDIMENKIGATYRDNPGAGAAGGLGFAFLTMGAKLIPGAKLMASAIQLEPAIASADLVLTGEGRSDEQTLYGKAPGYVATLANKHHVPAILISGSLGGDKAILRSYFAGCFSITQAPMTLQTCIQNADSLLLEQTKQVMHLIHVLKKSN